MGKTNGFPWRTGAFYHGDDQQFWCGINVIFRCGNFRNLQCTICIFRGGTGHFTGYLDVYFSGSTDLKSDDHAQKICSAYLFSFVVGFAFSELLDLHEAWIDILPKSLGFCVLYFVISYLLLCIGIAFSNRCGLPIIPTDLFPRELSQITGVRYSRVKIGYDVICLCVTAVLTVCFWDI